MPTITKAMPEATRTALYAKVPVNVTADQIATAFAACRSIRFAVKNASRWSGEFSLNDILAADRLAREALGEAPKVSPAAKPLKRRAVRKGGAA
jgi:hypothetical protein